MLKLLQGLPVRDPDYEGECTTPTGASLLRALTAGQAAPANVHTARDRLRRRNSRSRRSPEPLRLIAIEAPARKPDDLLLMQSDVDDLSPEYVPPLIDAMLAAGSLDCTAMPLVVKKGRSGIRVEALLAPDRLAAVATALFAGSSSIGYLSWPVSREALSRREERVTWRG